MLGSLDFFDVSIKKLTLKGKYELNYLAPSKIRITDNLGKIDSVISSGRGLEISNIEILKDRFVVAHTPLSLLFGDIKLNKSTEIEWSISGNEKYRFRENGLCTISNAGEVTVIRIGEKGPSISFRSEFTGNKHLSLIETKEQSLVAYLIDQQTIRVLNMRNSATLFKLEHDRKISRLSLSPSGENLLFKDHSNNLFLYKIC